MNSKEFLIGEIRNIVVAHPRIRCRYEIDDFHTHVIEITPRELFGSDEQLALDLVNLYKKFSKKFPAESLGYLTEKSAYKLEEIEFEVSGAMYGSNYETSKVTWINNISLNDILVDRVFEQSSTELWQKTFLDYSFQKSFLQSNTKGYISDFYQKIIDELRKSRTVILNSGDSSSTYNTFIENDDCGDVPLAA